MRRRVLGLVWAASLLLACEGGRERASRSDGTTGAGPVSSGPTIVAGGGQVSSLTGTWDLVTTRATGREGHVVIDVHPDFLSVVAEEHMLLLRRSPEGWEVHHRGFGESWRYPYNCDGSVRVVRGRTNDVTARHAERTELDVGELPIDLGGRWRIAGEADFGCDLVVGDGAVDLSCGHVHDDELPWLPSLNRRNAHLERVRRAASMFGDLGGEWTYREESGETECTLLFEGSRMRIACAGGRRFVGNLDLVFGDGVVSGATDRGIEIAGIRR